MGGCACGDHASRPAQQEFKLAKKYAPDKPLIGPMTNLYLDARRVRRCWRQLPGARMSKRRHKVGGFMVDVFEGPLERA